MNHRKEWVFSGFCREAASPLRVGIGKKHLTEGALETRSLPWVNGHDEGREKLSGVVG